MAPTKGSGKKKAPAGDDSHLDQRYFVDRYVYNCPFCKRRNVSYFVTDKHSFDWSLEKKCHVYFVRCQSCSRESMHLSYTFIGLTPRGSRDNRTYYSFEDDDLDSKFFHSVPSSFFVLDQRVPRVLRELFFEAEGCLKGNFLTGASACVRKAIYELAVIQKATGTTYDERIKSLKTITSNVDGIFFDTLLAIQEITSVKVHEQSYDGWDSKHLRVIVATVLEILNEIFVVPAEREKRRAAILEMKQGLNERPSAQSAEEAKAATESDGNETTDAAPPEPAVTG